MEIPYQTAVCDLCGSKDYSVLLRLKTGRAMRSDRLVIPHNLEKYSCSRCGLVRSGQAFDNRSLQDIYADDYRLSEQVEEYFFHTPEGPISRSSIFRDWIISATAPRIWQPGSRCLEVGAGSGLLLKEFTERFPEISFEGVELNRDAVNLARSAGLNLHQGEPSDLEEGGYDLIYSIAVIEHVPSPTRFIEDLRRLLRPGGWLFLCQPTQDVPSYDIFFADHLHHFGSRHLAEYARKGGFLEHKAVVGHKWMPNFSLHPWQAVEPEGEFLWEGPPVKMSCEETAQRIVSDMEHLNAMLASLSREGRRVAVFGLNEVYWLTRAYSELGDFHIVCGLDDNPHKAEYARLGFPVMVPEDCTSLGVQDVILTMNKVFYEFAQERLARLGLKSHPVLS